MDVIDLTFDSEDEEIVIGSNGVKANGGASDVHEDVMVTEGESDLSISLPPSPPTNVSYYQGNQALPIYGTPPKGVSKEKILHILLDPKFDSRLLCTDHPVRVENNVAFVIDVSKLRSRNDVGADDLGTWVCTGSRVLTFTIEMDEEECYIVSGQVSNRKIVHIRRQYHVHGTDRDLHRMTAYVDTSTEDIVSSRCLVQYWFSSGNEHSVYIKAHGNSKRKRESYCRTHPSTFESLKEHAKSHTAKDAVKETYASEGGILDSNSLGKLPRNRQQVSNLRRASNSVPLCSKKSLRDPLFMVMEQSKLCGNNFVRIVTATPEPMCILATDQQLRDLERFSTNSNSFSVVSVDPTFSLGDFSVTCLAYRHLLVVDRRTNESPIMLGPVFVHQRKTFQTYHFFASTLVSLLPSLDKMLAFGTDGEEALAMAFEKQFKLAIHLRCFRHLKQNVRRKLCSDIRINEQQATEILSHIFGVKSGPTFFEGLVDTTDECSFEEKLALFKVTWDEMCPDVDGQGMTFYTWFRKYHAKVIKTNMLKPIRQAAGLGDPPAEFHTNDSEAINSTLKQFLHFKKSDWPLFNDKIKEFVMEQQTEVEKSIVGIGQYAIRNEYSQFNTSSSRWFSSFNKDQKQSALSKFHKASVDDKCEASSSSSAVTPHTGFEFSSHPTSSTTSNVMESESDYNDHLSITIEEAADITGLPTLFVRQVWSKAAELIHEGRICQAPCSSPYARIVASRSMKKPHFVSTKDDENHIFECDDDCPGFLQRYICSHTVAAAEDNKVLKAYLESYGKFVRTPKGNRHATPNFTRLAVTGLPRGSSGRKGGKAPRKKAIKRRDITEEDHRRDITCTITSEGDENQSVDHSSLHPPDKQTKWDYTPIPSFYDPGYYFNPSHYHPYSLGDYPQTFFPPLPFNNVTNQYNVGTSDTNESSRSEYVSAVRSTTKDNPFYIKLLTNRIKVCAGCKGPHMKDACGRILKSPNNLCIAHKEQRSYVNPQTGLQNSKEGNCYYHINQTCLLKRHSQFSASQLVCSEDVILDDAQKMLLHSTLDFTFP